MQQTFQCNGCGAQNYVGQPFCWNCQVELLYRCPKCGVAIKPTYINCLNCRETIPWPWRQNWTQISPTQQRPTVSSVMVQTGNGNGWLWFAAVVLIVTVIILGFFCLNVTNELVSTRNNIASIVDLQNKAASEYAIAQQSIISARKELESLKSSDTGLVLDAKRSLATFMTSASNGQYNTMWQMLHTDSQNTYTSVEDFQSNNPVAAKSGYYLFENYDFGYGQKLENWGRYSNVVEIKVSLIQKKDSVASFIIGLIPILGTLEKIMPSTNYETWDAHLIKVGGTWKVFCDKKSTTSTK